MPRSPSPICAERRRGARRSGGLAGLLTRAGVGLAIAALTWPGPGWAQSKGPASVQAQSQSPGASQPQEPPPPPKPPLPPEAQPLLSADLEPWMAGVAALRENPRARDVLLQALAAQPNSPRRWRLAHHLIEWGSAQDAPALNDQLNEAEGMERRALLGALTAIYPRPLEPVDLARSIVEFVYVPQDTAQPFAPEAAGKYLVTDLAIQTYHQDGLPVRVVERMTGLRGRPFNSRRALAEAMQKQLPGRQWSDYGECFLAPLFPVPERLSQAGALQVRLTAPATRPVLFVLDFQCWFGRFAQAPQPRYVFVAAGETGLVEVPVRLIAPAEPGQPRVFMRVQELNAPGQVEAQKLVVALRH